MGLNSEACWFVTIVNGGLAIIYLCITPFYVASIQTSLLFRTFHGIPIGGTAKIVSYRHLRDLIKAGVTTTQPNILIDDMARVAKAVQTDRLLSNAEITELMHTLWQRKDWRVMVEPLIRYLVQKPSFKQIWNRTTAVNRPAASAAAKPQQKQTIVNVQTTPEVVVSPVQTPEGRAVKAALENSLCGKFACEPVDHQK